MEMLGTTDIEDIELGMTLNRSALFIAKEASINERGFRVEDGESVDPVAGVLSTERTGVRGELE
jgi:hypothetical protein